MPGVAVISSAIVTVVLMVVVVFSLCDADTISTRDKKNNGGGVKRNSTKLILFSLDGFRWDYLSGRANTPTFDEMKRKGVYATHGIESAFLTNTLPNHFTLVTGLNVESHGMLDNKIIDPALEKPYIPLFYDFSAENHPDWVESVGEPIWVTNKLQRNGSSGVLMWMGGETAIKGVRPDRFHHYTEDMSEMSEMKLIIDWMTDSHDPVDLAVVYVPEPDITAHMYGPDSLEVTDKIQVLDSALAFLLTKLEESGLADHTDVILSSDHGFVPVSEEQAIQIDDVLDPTWYRSISTLPGPVMAVFPAQGREDDVYQRLKASADAAGTFQVYRKSDIPSRFHYKNHRRVPPVFAMADAGYSFVNRKNMGGFRQLKGNHGYDNALQAMRPFFLAAGPSFREGVSVETFRNVDIYPLMCHILDVRPAPNNGSMETVGKLLRHYKDTHSAEVKGEL